MRTTSPQFADDLSRLRDGILDLDSEETFNRYACCSLDCLECVPGIGSPLGIAHTARQISTRSAASPPSLLPLCLAGAISDLTGSFV